MKLFSIKKIRTRFTMWFLLLSIVPLFSVLTITYFWQTTIIKNQASKKLIAIRNLKVDQLENWLFERKGDMLTISRDNELTDLEYIKQKTHSGQNDKLILDNCRQILYRYKNNYPVYEEIFIINPRNGQILISTEKDREGMDVAKKEYFINAMHSQKLELSNIYVSKASSNNYSMAYSIPIFCSQHSGEHIVGILVARINLKKSLYKILLNRIGLGETGETLIVNKDVVALNQLRWHVNAPLKLQISANPAVNAAAGKTGIEITPDYRNQEVLAAYTYIPETKWGFICKQDIAELYAPIYRMLFNFIVLFIAVIIIVFFIGSIVSISVTKPIVKLNHTVRKINAGNLSARITVKSHDEVGELGLAFNTMTETIESKIKIQNEINNISETIITPTSLHEFNVSLLKKLMDITGANISIFYILNETTTEYEPLVSFGTDTELLKTFNGNKPDSEFKNTLAEKRICFMNTIPEDTILKYKAIANETIPKEIINIPIIIDNRQVKGLISLVNVNKFNKGSLVVIKQSWQSINISFSNLLSNERVQIMSESLLKSNEQLHIANTNLESFAYSVSHDLKAPLRAISQLSYWISEDYKDILRDDGKEQLSLLVSRVQRMDALIDGILQYSRIDRRNEEKKPINFNVLVKQVIDNLVLPENIEINIVNVLPEYSGDEIRFIQVFQNLISNSIKFSDKPKGKINIACSDEGENWRFSVEDNGPGIEKKYQERVFRIFETLSTRDTTQGSGLGLALVKKIINYYKGRIWIKSTMGKGTTFFFTLPKKDINKDK